MPLRRSNPGFLGWLGRQVGHVASAVRRDVGDESPPGGDRTVYRSRTVEQVPDPRDPRRTLRRTVIDEAIVRDGVGETVEVRPARAAPSPEGGAGGAEAE